MPVFARLILKVSGENKVSAEETLKNKVEKLKEENGIHLYKNNQMPAEEDNGRWFSVAEIELETINFRQFTALLTKHMPMSIEILDPLKIELNTEDFAQTINELLLKKNK